ncbi:hypothetical protein [Mycobacterium sp. OTB74]|jgi:hypothetical protein|uniref:hypothetical protein n=1 Tax=Mycobacterium sp. OTB74 TaxID=1853452 RepID=UPI0024758C40|nr:hypothetical protein [Mycobacterium sp. OTB74]MDH6245642.1 hypothetical protein [Mycobacterium sp. OTB74]
MSDQQGWQQPAAGHFPPAQPYPPGQPYPPNNYPPQPYSPQPYSPQPYSPSQHPLAGGDAWAGSPVPPRPSRRSWWIWGAVGVVVALVVAGVTWTFSRGDDTGADSPTAAVQGFLSAIERNDVLAAADLLEPTERAGVRSVLENASRAASNTGYQHGGGGNGLFDGIKFTADGLQTSVTQVGNDMARVTMTGGQISYSFDPARTNEGLRDLLADKNETERTWNTDKLTTRARKAGAKVPPAAMAVKRSGKWYVSLLYTYFDEAARHAGIQADPQPLQTRSFASPEEAAKGLVDGLMAMFETADITKLATVLSPSEGGMLSTYRQFFKMRNAIDNLEVTSTPKYDVKTTGNFTTVSVTNLTFEYTPAGSRASREIHFPECATSDASWCRNNIALPSTRRLPGLAEVNRHGFVVMQDGAGWHVNLFASYFNVAADYLGHATKEEVALLISRVFDSPRAFLRLDGQASVMPGSSTTVDLKAMPNTARQYMAVVDLPVRSGGRYTARLSGPRSGDWFIVGKSGELDHGHLYSSNASSFTAPNDETAKLVLISRYESSVSVSLAR